MLGWKPTESERQTSSSRRKMTFSEWMRPKMETEPGVSFSFCKSSSAEAKRSFLTWSVFCRVLMSRRLSAFMPTR